MLVSNFNIVEVLARKLSVSEEDARALVDLAFQELGGRASLPAVPSVSEVYGKALSLAEDVGVSK